MSLNFVLIISDDSARAERILEQILAAAANQQQQKVDEAAASVQALTKRLHDSSVVLKSAIDTQPTN